MSPDPPPYLPPPIRPGCPGVPVVFLANKSDLFKTTQEAFAAGAKMEQAKNAHGFAAWFATSCKNGDNVNRAMTFLTGQMMMNHYAAKREKQRKRQATLLAKRQQEQQQEQQQKLQGAQAKQLKQRGNGRLRAASSGMEDEMMAMLAMDDDEDEEDDGVEDQGVGGLSGATARHAASAGAASVNLRAAMSRPTGGEQSTAASGGCCY